MARDLLAAAISPQDQLYTPSRRQLLQVAQELKDRLRFSKLYSNLHPDESAQVKVLTAQQPAVVEHPQEPFNKHDVSMMHDDDFMELQQQFTEAKCVIKHLAVQLDHYSNIQQQLAGQVAGSQQEAAVAQCSARMYHQAMDECQRLQSENIALRQMLQNALEDSPGGRARSSSRGRNQTSRGRDSMMSAVRPHLSFVAKHEAAHGNYRRSSSPTLSSFVRTGGGYAPLEYGTGHAAGPKDSDCSDFQAATEPQDLHQLQKHHHSNGNVKPGAWAPSVVVELVTRFARRLSQDVAWPEIQELLVLINQVYSKQYEEMVSGLQQQHAKCAGSLKRQVAHAEPYVQVRDRQVIAHLKAQLAQAQANRKQPSRAGGRKAQAQVHMAMEKCLHMDRQLEMLAAENHSLKRNMGVYIAEAQRAKRILQHSRAAQGEHMAHDQHAVSSKYPPPPQLSHQHAQQEGAEHVQQDHSYASGHTPEYSPSLQQQAQECRSPPHQSLSGISKMTDLLDDTADKSCSPGKISNMMSQSEGGHACQAATPLHPAQLSGKSTEGTALTHAGGPGNAAVVTPAPPAAEASFALPNSTGSYHQLLSAAQLYQTHCTSGGNAVRDSLAQTDLQTSEQPCGHARSCQWYESHEEQEGRDTLLWQPGSYGTAGHDIMRHYTAAVSDPVYRKEASPVAAKFAFARCASTEADTDKFMLKCCQDDAPISQIRTGHRSTSTTAGAAN